MIKKDRIALICEDHTLTYGQLEKEILALSKLLLRRKLAFIMMRNNMESVISYVTCLYKKVVPLLIHNNISNIVFADLLERYRPYYIIIPQDYKRDILNYHILVKLREYYILEVDKDYCVDYTMPSELALLLSTSGSTGSPKCVKITYKNLKSNTLSIINSLKILEIDRVITTLPMDYTFGLSIINTHLYQGASILLTDIPIIYNKFWDLLYRYKCTTFSGVPYTYDTLIKLNLLSKLTGLRYITQAGGKLSKKSIAIINEVCKKNNIEFIIMYGQTEATARMSYLPYCELEKRIGSIGIAIPGGKFQLVDKIGNIISTPKTVGELVYFGENVSMGYACNYEDLKKGDERQGLLRTGDLAERDNDDFYYIVGRKRKFHFCSPEASFGGHVVWQS